MSHVNNSNVITILFINSMIEFSIVSAGPIDIQQNILIVEIMRTLKRMIQSDIRIIT